MVNSGSGWWNFSIPPGQSLLFSGLFFLPVLSPSLFGWVSGLLAVPVFYLLTSNGYDAGKKILFLSLLTAGAGALLTQRLEVFLFSLTLIPLGFSLVKSAQANESAAMSGGKGLVTLCLTWLVFWGTEGVITETNPYSQLLKAIDLGFEQTLEIYTAKEAGLSPEMVHSLVQVTSAMRETMPRLLPGLLLLMLTMTVWINMLFVNNLTMRLAGIAPWGSYIAWKLPEQLVWLPIVAIITILLGSGFVGDAGTWLLMIAGLLYFIQGLAVFNALMIRWKVPVFVRVIFYVLCFIQSYGLIILAILGLSDTWFNLREKK